MATVSRTISFSSCAVLIASFAHSSQIIPSYHLHELSMPVSLLEGFLCLLFQDPVPCPIVVDRIGARRVMVYAQVDFQAVVF